ncbi:MAG: TonB-dependent receptor [Candidatus Aminicenantes bacterium]|nr:TonB-dependent receptor [Candidatus Aminicenantes bacterium]
MKHWKHLKQGFLGSVFFGLVLFSLVGMGVAQTTLVTLQGVITDEDGAPLPGTTITVKNVETGYVYHATSRADGSYIISGMEAGKYECLVSLSSFASELRRGMTFNIGAKLSVDFVLKPAALEEEVTVTAESPMVEVTKSEISGVVNREEIDNLPLLDRNFADLSILQAGVQTDPSWEGNARSNALPWGMEEILVDGVSNEEGISNGPNTTIPVDAVQEFRVLTNQFAAEYGSAAGMLRSAITRSGTNEFRGRASFFLRDEMFDTPNYFVDHDGYKGDTIDDVELPDYKHNNLSAFLGGPIIKDKLHFFLTYEGIYRKTYDQITSPLVPAESVEVPETRHYMLGKFNYQLNPKNLFALRITLNRTNEENSGTGGLFTKEMAMDYPESYNDFQLSWTSFFSESITNEFRFLYAWRNYTYFSSDPAQGDAFSVERPGGWFGKPTNAPQSGWSQRYQFVDNLSVYIGNHNLKFGFDYSWAPMGGNVNIYNPGYYQFTTNDPFDSSNPMTYPFLFLRMTGDTIFTLEQNQFALFAQDSWSVSPRLTLNFGLRYNYFTMSKFDIRAFDFPANFSPRIGFSWDPVGDRKTSIRGGIGTFSSNFFGNAAFQWAFMSIQKLEIVLFPNYPTPDAPNPFWPLFEQMMGMPPGYLSSQGGPQSLGIFKLSENMKTPYALQASLGAQREVMKDLSVAVDFAYTRGYNLFTTLDENPVIPGTGGLRQDPTIGSVEVVGSTGKSDFKGIYFTINKRYSNGWSLDLAYTLSWSKSNTEFMDSVESYDADGWERQYGYNLSDARHRITLSGVFDLPWGFQISGIVFYRSALPWTAYYGFDENLDTLNSDYLDYHRNSRRGLDTFYFNTRISKYININRFRIQLFGEVYNATNRANFYSISPNQNTPDFGEPTQALDPRLVQLGIRVDF